MRLSFLAKGILLLVVTTIFSCSGNRPLTKTKIKTAVKLFTKPKNVITIKNWSKEKLNLQYTKIDFDIAKLNGTNFSLLLSYVACEEIKPKNIKFIWSGEYLLTDPKGIKLLLVQDKKNILPVCQQTIKLAMSINMSFFDVKYIMLDTLITGKNTLRIMTKF